MNAVPKILAVSVLMLLALCASAQGEEGVIPKLWKKLTVKDRPAQAPSTTSPASGQKTSPAASGEPAPMMTNEEMVGQIKFAAGFNDGILEDIPELKKSSDKDGKEIYTYSNGEKTVNIEDLDADTLGKLFDKVNIQANAYQANIAAQQMEAARESQRVFAMQQQMPRALPPQPPRPPSPPPQPPRR